MPTDTLHITDGDEDKSTIWDILDRRLRRRHNQPSNHQQLCQALIKEWQIVPIAQVNRLIDETCTCWTCCRLVEYSVLSVADFDIIPGHHRAKEKDSKFETYVTKKTIAQGMLDIGLLTANASQMKSLIGLGSGQEFYYVNMVLISLSIFLQVIVGLVLLKLGSVKYKQPSGTHQAERLNHFVMALILIVIVLNVFIAAFGIEEKNKTT